MTRFLNTAVFVGRLGADPTMVFASSGTAITTFSIAVADDYFDKSSEEWVDRTQWIGLKSFGDAAERHQESLKKGDLVSVTTTVKNNNYEKDGVKVYTYDFVVDHLVKLSSRAETPTEDRSERSSNASKSKSKSSARKEPAYQDPF